MRLRGHAGVPVLLCGVALRCCFAVLLSEPPRNPRVRRSDGLPVGRKAKRIRTIERVSSPGVDGQKGLRLQSSTVDTSIPFSARHFEYSIEHSMHIPCRQTAIGWPTVDFGAWRVLEMNRRRYRENRWVTGSLGHWVTGCIAHMAHWLTGSLALLCHVTKWQR
eukprot:6333206-Pyramimonas_sp.AAC.1